MEFLPFRSSRTPSKTQPPTETVPPNFRSLFSDALLDYRKRTGEDLLLHPLASKLKNCDSPGTILPVLLEEQTRALGQPRINDESSTQSQWLRTTVPVLYRLSQGIENTTDLLLSPVKVIFVGIGVFLSAARAADSSQGAIVKTFENVERSFRRLEICLDARPNAPIKEMNEHILLAVLSILALVTEEMRTGQPKRNLEWLKGGRKPAIEDALQKLEKLIQQMENNGRNSDLPSPSVSGGRSNTVTPQQAEIQRWLSPSDPSINYDLALKSRHQGTARWLLQSEAFATWKSTSSFLWVNGKPGSGKSVLCAAIIDDVEVKCKHVSASIAYFFFDFNDDQKQSCHDMATSLLTQLSAQSEPYREILSRLRLGHDRGARMPTSRVVTECLKEMLSLPNQGPVYIILDAIDECPNTGGVPSPREEILGLVKGLVELKLPNLRLCVTCRREPDISSVFDPLYHFQLSLQDEPGQKKDIVKYVTDIVDSDPSFKMWSEDDKKLVIFTLSERADGMFRWAYCQVDNLRHSPPSTAHRILNEFPETLDGTYERYERILEEINNTKKKYAYGLLRCLTVAIRPLRVKELAEILATDFDDGEALPEIKIDWRQEDPEQAVLSVCPGLVEVVNLDGAKVVQFCHPSVKEYLTSDRLAASSGRLSSYRVNLELAHTNLVKACLSVLLQVDAQLDSGNPKPSPLVEYAARYWVNHARFENVASHVQAETEKLFDPKKPYFANWVKIYDMDKPTGSLTSRRTQPNPSPLYYAVLCDFPDLASHLIDAYPKDVDIRGGQYTTAIHAALYRGHLSIARLLIPRSANLNSQNDHNMTPLHIAARYSAQVGPSLPVVPDASATKPDQSPPLSVASNNARDNRTSTPLQRASVTGNSEIVELLIKHKADLNALDDTNSTPLHLALVNENFDIAKSLIHHGAGVKVSNDKKLTPLHLAAVSGRSDVITLLLDKGADVNSKDDNKSTPLHLAAGSGSLEVVKFLLGRGADMNAQDNKRTTPLHLASRRGSLSLVELLLDRGADPNAQNDKGWTALHIASQEGAIEVVRRLLKRGANVNIKDGDGRTPLHVASNNKKLEIVRLLMENGADPSVPDARGQTPLQLGTAGLSASSGGMQRSPSARSNISSGPGSGSRPVGGN